jgi:hypothetical protein
LLTAIARGANVADAPLGKRQPSGNVTGTRGAMRGSPDGAALRDAIAPPPVETDTPVPMLVPDVVEE